VSTPRHSWHDKTAELAIGRTASRFHEVFEAPQSALRPTCLIYIAGAFEHERRV
jgi:hypothetical protein